MPLYAYLQRTKVCTKGIVCDPYIYAEALHMYEEKFSQFKNWGQRSFWRVRIGEYLAYLLGTGYLRPRNRAFAKDEDLLELDCTLEDNSSYLAFRRPIDSIPGFHFFIGPEGEIENNVWAGAGGQVGAKGWASEYEKFLDLIKQKEQQKGISSCKNICMTNVDLSG